MIVKPGLFAKPRSATLISLSIIAGDCRFLHSLGRDSAVFHHPTVEKMHGSIGMLGEPLVVRNYANHRATGVQFREQIHNGFTVARIEIPGRLIREHELRLASE